MLIPEPFYRTHSLEESVANHYFLERLRARGLLPMWEYILDNNPKGTRNSYHNNYHAFHVARMADLLLQTLNDTVWYNVIVAALFHDYDHSGGVETDAANIDHAIAGFRGYLAQLKTPEEQIPFVAVSVEHLIRATQFPWVNDGPEYHHANTLRDADILACFSQSGVSSAMEGLRAEFSVGQPRLISLDEMVDRQRQFVNGLQLNTKMGRAIWEGTKAHYIQMCSTWANTHR